jgi:two-component system, sensor histidine kinase
MQPNCQTSSDKVPAASATGKSLNTQPGINGDETVQSSAVSAFDRLMEHARIEELGNADRRKDEFLATVCHELRSPIGAIQNAVKVLRVQNDNRVAVHRIHELIERQAQQMAFLVGGLLDITRIVRGQLTLQHERVDLRAVLRNSLQTLEWDLKGRSHQLSLTLRESGAWLMADGARLEQVFVNLLGNASKYTQIGGEIALSLHASDGFALVRVRDSGIGISPDALPHVFDLFMQADTAPPRSGSGLGIGLALVRAIVQAHGGSVMAFSAGLGQGSEFTVRLPLE